MGDALPDRERDARRHRVAIAPGEPEHLLKLFRNGEEVDSVPIDSPGGTHEFRAETTGRYRIQLENDGVIVALTSAIWVPEPGGRARDGRGGVRARLDAGARVAGASQRAIGAPSDAVAVSTAGSRSA